MMAFMGPPPNRRKRRTANGEQLNSPATASRPLVQTTTATDPSPCTLPPKGARGKGLRPLNGGNAVGVVRSGGATDLPRSFGDSPGMTLRYLVPLSDVYGTRYRFRWPNRAILTPILHQTKI